MISIKLAKLIELFPIVDTHEKKHCKWVTVDSDGIWVFEKKPIYFEFGDRSLAPYDEWGLENMDFERFVIWMLNHFDGDLQNMLSDPAVSEIMSHCGVTDKDIINGLLSGKLTSVWERCILKII